MRFSSLGTRCPALADRETRVVSVPGDQVGFIEHYCTDADCDCRRVVVQVASRDQARVLATIHYGWESPEFYAALADDPLAPGAGEALKGPFLAPDAEQSERAAAMLAIFRDSVLPSPGYTERLARHYAAFRAADPHSDDAVAERIARRKERLAKRRRRKKRRK